MAKRKIISNATEIPAYQREFYSNIYESQWASDLLNRQWLLNLLTFGYSKKLAQACADEVNAGARVLQLGATFGDQLGYVAQKIGIHGQFDVVDVSLTQLRNVRNRNRFLYPFMNFINRDALEPFCEKYDVIICYMLLHELPLPAKSRLINQVVSKLAPDGKAIFVDYNNMVWWHPLRWFVKMFNRLHQPFAERMWQSEIKNYVSGNRTYEWKKTTYFGKMYQKVTVTRKKGIF